MSNLKFMTRLAPPQNWTARNAEFPLPDHGKDFNEVEVEGHEVALILIDLWERHHCIPIEIRTGILAKKINQLLPAMRGNGIRR